MRAKTEAALTAGLADPREVSAWAEDLSDAFITCRDMGHTWRPFRARINEDYGYDRVLRCGRCKTEREQAIDSRGMPVTSHYSYPDGYTAPAGTGRLTGESRGALRLESTLRLISKDEK